MRLPLSLASILSTDSAELFCVPWFEMQGDVKELSLNFSLTDEEFGNSKIIELRPGGANIEVDNVSFPLLINCFQIAR